ncbi:MAG: type II toxin-antitoxin system Phd/YefM family antitoxin [Rhodospirillales bacterium]|nr:type II toxin-antitoxin system Phd/YefM family antitoxin [Rhodospirillales bacterium]
MTQTTIHAAKTHLSKLIKRACAGEDIVIARGKTPLVRLVPVDAPEQGRRFGAMRGRARVDDAFFEPLPADELDTWDN